MTTRLKDLPLLCVGPERHSAYFMAYMYHSPPASCCTICVSCASMIIPASVRIGATFDLVMLLLLQLQGRAAAASSSTAAARTAAAIAAQRPRCDGGGSHARAHATRARRDEGFFCIY